LACGVALLLAGGWLSLASAQVANPPPALPTTVPGPSAASLAPEYRLAPGDVIRVVVYQNPDLTLESRVGDNGLLSYPLLGSVPVGGLSVQAAEARIAEGLRNGNFVKQPQVTIVVTQVRGHQVSVLGQVNRAGRYAIESGEMRLSELLAVAGGIGPNGTDVVVLTGTREGRPFRLEVDLPAMFLAGGRDTDVVVRNGDTVWVDRQALVYIYGEVQRPGALRLERGMTLLQALAAGGGLTQRGTERGIRLHRRSAAGPIESLQPAMNDRLQGGDVVYVRESLF
jgi:polysaccharide export outer membrane protein